MYFDIKLSELNLAKACIHGMDHMRDELWERCLRETKDLWRELPDVRDDDARGRGLDSIEALREKNTAKDAGSIENATRRYSYEERLRGKMSGAIEGQLPFVWNCNWSCTDLRRRAQEICLLFHPLLARRKSRLLPSFPVSVLASIMDCIYREGAEKPHWWKNEKNVSKIIGMSLDYMRLMSEGTNTKEEEEHLYAFVHLVSITVSALLPVFFKNKTLHASTRIYELLESDIVNRVEGGSKKNAKAIYLDKETAENLINHASMISPSIGAEFSMFFLTQKAIIAVDDGKKLLEKFCYVDKREEAQFCIDPLIMDVMYLLCDITSTIQVTLDKENESIVAHFMNVLQERPIQGKHISFRKLFMIATVLMKGFEVEEDLTNINEGIICKLGVDGVFSVKRKPWKRLAVEERKRAPKFQPKVAVIDDQQNETGKVSKKRHRQTSKMKPTRQIDTNISKQRIQALAVVGEDEDGSEGNAELINNTRTSGKLQSKKDLELLKEDELQAAEEMKEDMEPSDDTSGKSIVKENEIQVPNGIREGTQTSGGGREEQEILQRVQKFYGYEKRKGGKGTVYTKMSSVRTLMKTLARKRIQEQSHRKRLANRSPNAAGKPENVGSLSNAAIVASNEVKKNRDDLLVLVSQPLQ